MKKLLIIRKAQYGYHIDSYKYTVYLKDKWDITYYCFDLGREKVVETNVNVVYVSSKGTFYKRAYRFFSKLQNLIKLNSFDVIFVVTFDFSFLVRLFSFKPKFVLDIRSASVNNNRLKEFRVNALIKLNTLFFNNITVISEGVAKRLKIKNVHILPLGSDVMASNDKDYLKLELIYIGTLDNRNIEKTIKGLSLFIEREQEINYIKYHIFGDGSRDSINKLNNSITTNNLQANVIYHGYKKHSEIKEYFDRCNIGVSFIPMTPYYEHQPPTKTFEYILSGMVCIATSTYENSVIVNETNGVLCEDNADSFSLALEEVYINRQNYNASKIRKTLKNNTWNFISKNNLDPYLRNV